MDKNGSSEEVKIGWILRNLKVEFIGVVEVLIMWCDRNRGVKSDFRVFVGGIEMVKF